MLYREKSIHIWVANTLSCCGYLPYKFKHCVEVISISYMCICDCIISLELRAYSYWLYFLYCLSNLVVGQVARHQYEGMRREAACLNVQKHSRKFLARKAYKNLYFSAVSIQAGMCGMTARNELLFRKQTRAATVIQVKIKILSINEILTVTSFPFISRFILSFLEFIFFFNHVLLFSPPNISISSLRNKNACYLEFSLLWSSISFVLCQILLSAFST